MSVTKFLFLKVTGGADLGERFYDVFYRVFTDDPMDGPAVILTSTLSPFRALDPYQLGNDFDNDAFLTDVQLDPVEGNRYEWNCKMRFGFLPEGEREENPFDRPPKFEWLFNSGEKAIERDVHGRRIANAAGDRFDEIITREDSQPVLKITRNEPADMLFVGFDIRDTVNRNPWLGAPRRTVKFQPPRAVGQYSRLYGLYYEKSYEFKFSDETWRLVMLNQGLRELKLIGAGPERELVPMKVKGTDITEPLALDQDGKRLPEGQEPIYLEFDGYNESTFPEF